MSSFVLDLLIAAMMIGGGAYAVYSSVRLKKERYLFANKLLYPNNCPPESCNDVEGFIDYMAPRMILFGVVCVILGAATLVLSRLVFSMTVTIFEVAVMLAVFVYIAVVQNRASKIFW